MEVDSPSQKGAAPPAKRTRARNAPEAPQRRPSRSGTKKKIDRGLFQAPTSKARLKPPSPAVSSTSVSVFARLRSFDVDFPTGITVKEGEPAVAMGEGRGLASAITPKGDKVPLVAVPAKPEAVDHDERRQPLELVVNTVDAVNSTGSRTAPSSEQVAPGAGLVWHKPNG
jgi:hypothetical protein